MATRYNAQIGDDIALEAVFSLGGDPTDVFAIDRVELLNGDLEIIATVEGLDVVQLATGHYQATFLSVDTAGTLSDHWIYKRTEESATSSLVLSLEVADFSGAPGDSGDDEVVPPPDNVPDIDLTKICKVTHQFIDGGGVFFPGVYVRFRPTMTPVQSAGLLTAARQTTVISDAEGKICIYLLRNITGTLTISGIGLSREVIVPDVAAIDLMSLMSTAPDLLEVQKLNFVDLPRRS